MCRALSIVFFEFYIIIAALLSHNNFVGTCLENQIYSSMEDINYEALSPETVAINSASVELVDNVDCILLLQYTAAPKTVITNDPVDII